MARAPLAGGCLLRAVVLSLGLLIGAGSPLSAAAPRKAVHLFPEAAPHWVEAFRSLGVRLKTDPQTRLSINPLIYDLSALDLNDERERRALYPLVEVLSRQTIAKNLSSDWFAGPAQQGELIAKIRVARELAAESVKARLADLLARSRAGKIDSGELPALAEEAASLSIYEGADNGVAALVSCLKAEKPAGVIRDLAPVLDAGETAVEAVLVEKGVAEPFGDGTDAFHSILKGRGLERPVGRKAAEQGVFIAPAYRGPVKKLALLPDARYLVLTGFGGKTEQVWQRLGDAAAFRFMSHMTLKLLHSMLRPDGAKMSEPAASDEAVPIDPFPGQVFVGMSSDQSLTALDAKGLVLEKIAPPEGENAGQTLWVHSDAYDPERMLGSLGLQVASLAAPSAVAIAAVKAATFGVAYGGGMHDWKDALALVGVAFIITFGLQGLPLMLIAEWAKWFGRRLAAISNAEDHLLESFVTATKISPALASRPVLFVRMGALAALAAGTISVSVFLPSVSSGATLYACLSGLSAAAGLGLAAYAVRLIRLLHRTALLWDRVRPRLPSKS